MIRFAFLKHHSGSYVENRLSGGREKQRPVRMLLEYSRQEIMLTGTSGNGDSEKWVG